MVHVTSWIARGRRAGVCGASGRRRRGLVVLVLVLLAGAPVGPQLATAQEEVVVANDGADSITVYARTASGDAVPVRTLKGPTTGLRFPFAAVVDPVHAELLVVGGGGFAALNSVTVYSRVASGDVAPLRTLSGAATGLNGLSAVALDRVHDEIFVVNEGNVSITVYPRTASGNTPPLRALSGPSTGLAIPTKIAVDLIHEELVVTNQSSITVYARTASGNTAPLRTLTVPSQSLLQGVSVDQVHDELVVATQPSVMVFARTASGNAAPLRVLSGSATGLQHPLDVFVDLINDELVVANQGDSVPSITIYPRTASGNAAPLRTLKGDATALSVPQSVVVTTSPPLAAAILPGSRSVQVGTPATVFATLLNAGSGPAAECAPTPISPLPATFSFQTTNPLTNALTGSPNTPADIPAGSGQSFLLAFSPSAPFAPTDVSVGFVCVGTNAAPVIVGVDTVLLVASNTPVPDVVALGATLSGDGIVNIPGANGTGLFVVATVNVGAGGQISASADTGAANLPVGVTLCQTDPTTSVCLAAPGSSVTARINANATPTFGIFVAGSGTVPFDPANNRVFVRFTDADGVTRGATSVAVRTQ
jgi:hypothetical protein